MLNESPGIHPDLRLVAQYTPRISFSRRNLWAFNALMRLLPPARPRHDLSISNITIRLEEERRNVRLRVYRPAFVAVPAAVLLWFHGGGYIMGKPKQDDRSCAQLSAELGIPIVSVDYRCAPKHPFPAGLEDGYAALRWLASPSNGMSIDTSRIAVGGASAGGGLAASLAQFAHDRQEIKPVFQLLVYPMLDDRTVLRKDIDDSKNVTWTHESNRFGWESYLQMPCGAEHVPEYAVPARRKDFSGLPPAWIGVGTLDIFHDESLAYAQKLVAAGVHCETCVVPGAFHGFDVLNPALPVVQNFRQSQIAALRQYLRVEAAASAAPSSPADCRRPDP